MMKIEYVVEDIILLVLENYEPLKKIGISKDKIFVKVKGYDENGIWIYHPSFEVPNNRSKTRVKVPVRHQTLPERLHHSRGRISCL